MSRRTFAIAAALSVLALGSPLINANANPIGDKLHNSGAVKHKEGDYQGAIDDYTKAIEFNPQDAYAFLNRAAAKQQLKDYQGAIADYTKVLEINPQYAKVYNERGVVKNELKDYHRTLERFDSLASSIMVSKTVFFPSKYSA